LTMTSVRTLSHARNVCRFVQALCSSATLQIMRVMIQQSGELMLHSQTYVHAAMIVLMFAHLVQLPLSNKIRSIYRQAQSNQ